MNTINTVTTLGLVALATLGLTLSGCKRKSPEEKAAFVVDKVTRKLELNENQQAKFKSLVDEAMLLRKKHRQERKAQHEKMKEMLLSEKIDEKEARKLYQEKKSDIDSGFEKLLPQFIEFHSSLSADQKTKAVELLEKFKKRRHGKWSD